jgi:hypothetical protein
MYPARQKVLAILAYLYFLGTAIELQVLQPKTCDIIIANMYRTYDAPGLKTKTEQGDNNQLWY